MFVHDGGDGKGGLWCEFPDLPGCMTDGDNLEDLMGNAADALEGWLKASGELGRAIPSPSNAETLKGKADACGEHVMFIVPVTGYLPDMPTAEHLEMPTACG